MPRIHRYALTYHQPSLANIVKSHITLLRTYYHQIIRHRSPMTRNNTTPRRSCITAALLLIPTTAFDTHHPLCSIHQNSQFLKCIRRRTVTPVHDNIALQSSSAQSNNNEYPRSYNFWNNEHSTEYELWEHFAPHNKKGRDDLPLRYIEEYGRIWHERLKQLTEYKTKHGNCNVPVQYEANPQLGRWVNKQRIEYLIRSRGDDHHCITQERIDALNDIDFCWGLVRSPKEEWPVRYRQLKLYREEHGDCNVPHEYPENESLGHWVSYQRWDYSQRMLGNNANENESSSDLSDKRIKALNAIQFTWNVNQEGWDQRCAQLMDYKRKHGDCNVPMDYEEIPQLGAWVQTQRTEYRLKKLSKMRTKLLNEMGFSWNYGTKMAKEQWRRRFEELMEYKNRYGDCNVPQGFVENPQLAIWVVTQRRNHRKIKDDDDKKITKITKDRMEALESIGFQWQLARGRTKNENKKRFSWDERYQQLQVYRDQFGDCNVPYNYSPNRGLGVWVSVQRQHYKLFQRESGAAEAESQKEKKKKSIMTNDRIAALEAVDFSWESKNRVSWEQRYQDLIQFKDVHGHCNVPRNYENDQSLGRWAHLQREQYKKLENNNGEKSTTLTTERVQAMEAIGFVLNGKQHRR